VAEELLDVLDEEGQPAGARKSRDEVHASGDWHRAIHVWIVKEGRYVLFQRRAKGKDLEPFKLDVTVGGHLRAGETIMDAVREIEEEVGLHAQFKDLDYLGTLKSERCYPDATDREFQEVYALACDQPLEHYHLDPDEVYLLYEVPLERAITLYRDGRPVAAAGYDAYGRRNDALLIEEDLIDQAREDVVTALGWLSDWLEDWPQEKTSRRHRS
jgi:isopentenyldiphosphate isomerase